jgi:choline dehydrogenase
VYNLIKQVEQETSNLVVKPNSFVTKILIKKGGKGKNKPVAYGVEVQEGTALYEAATGQKSDSPGKSSRKKYFARREIIVSGGTFNTPQMLMLSGVGPKDQLEALDIDVVADVPGVGKNLKDKIETTVNLEMPLSWKIFEQNCTFLQPEPSKDKCFLEYLAGILPNPYTFVGTPMGYQVKSPGASYPDLYGQIGPLMFVEYRDGWVNELLSPINNNILTFNLNNAMKTTVGEVTLKSADPFDMADIDFKGYTDDDIADSLFFLKQVLGIAQFLKDSGLATKIIAPGPEVDISSDAALKEYILDRAWGHHACCTAKIGADGDDMAVLDGQLRVRAVNNLRVVDNSAFPDDSAFFPLMSIYMLAEKAAEDIIESAEASTITKEALYCPP